MDFFDIPIDYELVYAANVGAKNIGAFQQAFYEKPADEYDDQADICIYKNPHNKQVVVSIEVLKDCIHNTPAIIKPEEHIQSLCAVYCYNCLSALEDYMDINNISYIKNAKVSPDILLSHSLYQTTGISPGFEITIWYYLLNTAFDYYTRNIKEGNI